jgi:Virulence factor BrkB
MGASTRPQAKAQRPATTPLWPLLCSGIFVAPMLASEIVRAYRPQSDVRRRPATRAFGTSHSSDDQAVVYRQRADEPGRGRHAEIPWQIPWSWQWITIGSVFAAVAWLISSALLSWYLASFADYNATYGSLGAGIGMMMWMWISSIVIPFGAQLNSEIEHQTARARCRKGAVALRLLTIRSPCAIIARKLVSARNQIRRKRVPMRWCRS